ncbi:CHASE3 domain-containing protein [Mycolicibacterium iranicum]|uniref:sensor histidine kinase n=1 Tax=Mycolicibacterium iranicum TaxID=912594 RepID=UPI000689176B|nr:CHASE3 domain-containing protein [Mycolicibacterium iranicum]
MSRLSLRQLIGVCLGVVAGAFVVASAAAVIGQVTIARAVSELADRVVPIQRDVEQIRRAYNDQETGQRAFILTGNPASLDLYYFGKVVADELLANLREELADDRQGTEILDRVAAAATTWRTQAAGPQIDARRDGDTVAADQNETTLRNKQLFDQLRSELRSLAAYTDAMGENQLSRIQIAEKTSTVIQIIGVVVLVAGLIVTVILLQRLLTRPVNTLLREVKRVADGDYDQPIVRTGLRETAEIAEAVEHMRVSLRSSTDKLIDSELRDEQARMAADLHDRVIQRVFGLGLSLTSAASRRQPDLTPFIDETDAIIRDLREVIFNLHQAISPVGRSTRLRSAIIDIVEGSAAALGYNPTLQFDGPIEDAPICSGLHAAVLAVVREALSNTARHSRACAASVHVTVTDVELRVVVRDDGIGLSGDDVMGHGRRNIAARATQFGGSVTFSNAHDQTGAVVDWAVPLTHPEQRETVDSSTW